VYYILDTDGNDNVYMAAEQGLNSHIELGMGISWDVKKDDITLPFRYQMSVVAGQTPELYAWYPGSDLMQQELVAVLRRAGVDNLQLFPAVIAREDNGEAVTGYVTTNIVGRISCAAMNQSNSLPLANVHYFHDLSIYSEKTGGQLMFRLDESPMVVLVHETVANAIESGQFLGLTLQAVPETDL
jgi:hypothetical protein